MTQWYLSYNGQQIGPLTHEQAVAKAQENPNGFAWREGFIEWLPISQVAELRLAARTAVAPPPVHTRVCDEIDFQIFGSEMQFVEIELDPGESVIAEAGAMMYKDIAVQMETVFGDGSHDGGSFMSKLLGAGKRLLTGESLFMTVFTHTGHGKSHVAFGAPYPGNIIPVTLANVGGCLICQKDSFFVRGQRSLGRHLFPT